MRYGLAGPSSGAQRINKAKMSQQRPRFAEPFIEIVLMFALAHNFTKGFSVENTVNKYS